MRFTVMPAEGGTIIQMRVYDRRKDESNNKTYVIPDSEQDVAHRVGQIVAMELIRLWAKQLWIRLVQSVVGTMAQGLH